jgi:cysteine-rich repeat protein
VHLRCSRVAIVSLALTGCFHPGDAAPEGSSSSGDVGSGEDESSSSGASDSATAPVDTSSEASSAASGASESSDSGGAAPACGDGAVDPEEDCDDGNAVDGDGCNVDCVSSGALRWSATYDGPASADDQANAVAVDAEGFVYVGGSHRVVADDTDVWIRRFDGAGTVDWTLEPSDEIGDDDPAGNDDAGGITLDGSGEMIVCGTAVLVESDAFVRRYTTGGALVWEAIFDSGVGSADHCGDVAVGPGDRVFAVGSHVMPGVNYDVWLASYDEDGELQWSSTYSGGGSYFDGAAKLTLDGAGRPVLAGHVAPGADQYDFWAGRWAIDGTGPEWSYVAASASGGSDRAYGIALDAAGFLRVVGETDTADDKAPFWATLDQDGGVVEAGTFQDDALRGFAGVAADASGNLVLVGHTGDESGSQDAWIAKLDPEGATLWRVVHDGDAHGDDRFLDVAIGEDGAITAVGRESVAAQGYDVLVMTFAP